MTRFTQSVSFLAISMFLFSSCMKKEVEDIHLFKTENITLKQGEIYTYLLPVNESEDPYKIVVDAQHANTNFLEFNTQTGQYIYHYTPKADYTGTDQVIIENGEESQSGCSNNQQSGGGHGMGNQGSGHHGDCHNKSETTYTVTLNFLIKPNKRPLTYRTVICPSF